VKTTKAQRRRSSIYIFSGTRGRKYMEVYDEIAHDMETSWKSMYEYENDRDPSARTRVTQGYNTPSQGKPAGVY
jgi:hypothetical protein